MSERRTGESTRLIDKYVQELFTNGTVTIIDHYDVQAAHEFLLRGFLKRMISEHPRNKLSVKGNTVTLLNK